MADTFTIKPYLAIEEDIRNYIVAHTEKVSDFNEGSIISSEIEAFSRQIEQLYIRARSNYSNYFMNIPFYVFNFPQKTGQYAGGSVVFSRNQAKTEVITFSAGTIVASDSGLNYITSTTATILSNQTESNQVDIVANKTGKDFNIPANSITTIISTVPGVDNVSNSVAITGGLDNESPPEYLSRFQTFTKGLAKSNKSGMLTGALSDDRVRSASIIEHFPPVDDIYNLTIYIDDGAGNASAGLVADVKAILEGDGTTANPGYKGGGICIRVLAPTKVPVDVVVTLESDETVDKDTIKYNVETAITNYINGLGVGENYIQKQLEKKIMEQIGVKDILEISPSANITILTGQIARIGTISVLWG